jgi:flagellar assembly factor FliW
MQEGMLGFPRLKRYLLIEDQDIQPFKWLQSLDDQYVAFPVVDPQTLFQEYAGQLAPDDSHALGIENQKDVVTLAVVVIAEDPGQATINLKAPLFINHKNMAGKQVVLTETSYSTHQPLVETTHI